MKLQSLENWVNSFDHDIRSLILAGMFISLIILIYQGWKLFKRVSSEVRYRLAARSIINQSTSKYTKLNEKKVQAISELRDAYNKESMYSGHLGSIRDGSEEDRQLNIQQDKVVTKLKLKLYEEVGRCYFDHFIRDEIREAAEFWNLYDRELTKRVMFQGTKKGCIRLISSTNVGFDIVHLDSDNLMDPKKDYKINSLRFKLNGKR